MTAGTGSVDVGRGLAALVLSAGLLMAVGGLSRVPYRADGGAGAVIRLSWRVTGRPVEECRRPTEEELAELPVHMRREEVCERRLAPWRLRVALDGRELERSVVRAAGAREDRPIYVYRELDVAPGRHRLEVSFVRLGNGDEEDEGEHGDADDPERGPGRLSLSATLALERGEVALITYVPETGSLALREGRP